MNENVLLKYDNDIAGTQIYYARKDKIDQALGRFINLIPDRTTLKFMFIRETEGVYRYGTKRINVKIEKGDKLLVRVGGGFMEI
jgi:hypothetical protein